MPNYFYQPDYFCTYYLRLFDVSNYRLTRSLWLCARSLFGTSIEYHRYVLNHVLWRKNENVSMSAGLETIRTAATDVFCEELCAWNTSYL